MLITSWICKAKRKPDAFSVSPQSRPTAIPNMFKRSIWLNPTTHNKYELFFAPELIPYLKKGQIFSTSRFGWDKYGYLKINDLVKIKKNNSSSILFTAKILSVSKTTFKNLPLRSGVTHLCEQNKEHQRKNLSGYYAFLGRPIADNDPFLIIEFELLQ